MNIMFLITGLGVGGAEKQVLDLSDRLVGLGYSVIVIYLTGAALIRPKSDKVKLVGLGMKRSVYGLVRTCLSIRRLIKEFRPDIVHSHMVHANLMARIVRLGVHIPRLICTAHNSNEGGRLRMIGYRLTDFLADVSTNVSAEAVAAFEAARAVKPGRMIAIHNGIDTGRFRPDALARDKLRKMHGIAENEKVIIAVGRLVEAKDYPNLFHAFYKTTRECANLKLWIVGGGELLDNLKKLARDLGIDRLITFWGVQDNIEDWLNAADVFVLSSAWEGFGLVVAEAMACQKVVVATDSGGVKEVLGDCGYLVPKKDPDSLASALREAIFLSPDRAEELGIKARARISSLYSLDYAVTRWVQLYESSELPLRSI